MRILSVTQIKRRNKGQSYQELQLEPKEGSRIREIYDALMSAPGKPVPLHLKTKGGGGKTGEYMSLMSLKLFYGLDIRLVRPASKKKGTCSLHALVGEWFGQIYVDYTCETEEQMELLLKARTALTNTDHAENLLPEGVHQVSKKDMEILRRIAEKSDAAMAKHSKRGP